MALLWGRSRSEGTETKHSIVPGLFTCFHRTWALTVSHLLRLSYRLEQAHSRHSVAGCVLMDTCVLNIALLGIGGSLRTCP